MSLLSFDQVMKDFYPLPGTRLKQWVVDTRREVAWERETCPKVDVPEHEDNTGATCRNSGVVPWHLLGHDCCETCEGLSRVASLRPDVKAWLAEKAKRPPIEQDRTKLSDEVQPDFNLERSPMLAWLRGEKR